ncbi:MAG TPA: lipoprotein-releasing ABC transporter permease subunit [Steroidobacteraceae bacterium]|nr:lipoprotein-releasing ABC transporter permease subunit [Steroidobacteraceae bacterium]
MSFDWSYEWKIGTRYLRSTHRSGFVSFVASMSVIGLALGVAVLIVVLSVLNGFERELRSRMLTVTSHATITGIEGEIANWRQAQRDAAREPGVVAVVPYVESRSLLANGDRVAGAMVRGILPEEEVKAVGLGGRMREGKLESLQAGKFQIILGSALALELAVKTGDKVVVMAPEGSPTPAGFAPRMRRFTVIGVFESGMYEFDRGLALTHMNDAATLYRLGNSVTGLRLALEDPFLAPLMVRTVARAIDYDGAGYFVNDWTRDHANFFLSIELTKSMMFFILLILVVVAAINLVATLVMIVKEKQTDIAILRTIGAAPVNVLKVFLVQGALIGLVGTIAGAFLGWALALYVTDVIHAIEKAFGIQFLDASVYLMSDLPSEVRLGDVLQVSGVALALSALATIYPAWRASRTLPAEALRHE